MNIGKKYIALVLLVFALLYVGIEEFLSPFLGNYTIVLMVLISTAFLLINFVSVNNKSNANLHFELDKKYKQLEILTSLYNSLDIKVPLPETGGWAASPDLLKKITEITLLKKPQLVVEASSGVSSIILGYCFKKIGSGKVISLEHDFYYYERNKSFVKKHGLEQFVHIVHAPLKEYDINNKKWLWYDIQALESENAIDMIVVDGPPFYIQDHSRYPVIPLLYNKMSDNSILILDDGVRDEEKEIIKRWDNEFDNILIEFFNFEFGAFTVRKNVTHNEDRTLLAFTTANQLEYNVKGIRSILENKSENIDLVVFDDASNDGTVEWCKDNNIPIVTKDKALGLTHSWNLAYQKFKHENYKHLIFANSDIIVPKGALEKLLEQNQKYIIVSPLSTLKGVGHQPLQDVKKYYTLNKDEYDYLNTQAIQDQIDNSDSELTKEVDYINGFFFSVNRDVINYEYSKDQLFDPNTINVGNEDDLCKRVKQPIAIVLNSYIFHFKGVSLEVTNMDQQSYDLNIYRNLNWQQAEELKNNPTKKLLFKVKYKINR